MPRLQVIEADQAEGAAAATLEGAPFNIFKGMANNPVVMEGLMALGGSFGKSGALTPAEAEAVMLRVSERNGCGYCLAAHTKIAEGHGIDPDAAMKYRRGDGMSERDQALLAFVDALATNRGWIEDSQFEAFRAAGFGDDAVVEVVALLAWMTFTNTFNHVNRTELDFPVVPEPTPV